MQEPKNTQSLEHLVKFLELRRDGANRSAYLNAIAAVIGGSGSAFLMYVGAVAYDHQTITSVFSRTIPGITSAIPIVAGGLIASFGLIFGARSISDYHRGNLLSDRIAEIKQSPDYKEYESSKGTVNGSHV